jgi:hypothetical protein
MGARAEAYAKQLEEANAELVGLVERIPDDKWASLTTKPEGWPLCVVAHHVAESHGSIVGLAQAVATGQPVPPLTMEMIDQGNAQHAREHATAGKAETLRLLREGGTAAAGIVRGLSDEQLDRTGPVLGNPMPASAVIEHILIDHVRQHLESVKGVL